MTTPTPSQDYPCQKCACQRHRVTIQGLLCSVCHYQAMSPMRECGCAAWADNNYEVEFCPLHAAAADMRDALEAWIGALDHPYRLCPHDNSTRYPTSAWFCGNCVERASAALDKARSA